MPTRLHCTANMPWSIQVSFCVDPPHFTVRPSAVYQRRLSQTVLMPCVAEGDPTPTVSWHQVAYTRVTQHGGAENAGVEKAGVENAGVENAGAITDGKP